MPFSLSVLVEYPLDEFLAREAPDFMPPQLRGRAIVHGHCHQKSLAGMTAELNLLAKASVGVR